MFASIACAPAIVAIVFRNRIAVAISKSGIGPQVGPLAVVLAAILMIVFVVCGLAWVWSDTPQVLINGS